jgi:hypothetical protein
VGYIYLFIGSEMIFFTLSGSAYELDRSKNQIRRLEGTEDPTPRQGPDGEWKAFEYCSEVQVDHSVLIRWEGVCSTITSQVKLIVPEQQPN